MNRLLGLIGIGFLLSGCGCDQVEEVELYYRAYKIPPAFMDLAIDTGAKNDDLFVDHRNRPTAREILISEGVSFPDGADLFFKLPISGFGMRNTEANHRVIEAYLDREFLGEWSIYSPPQSDPAPNDPFNPQPAYKDGAPDA